MYNVNVLNFTFLLTVYWYISQRIGVLASFCAVLGPELHQSRRLCKNDVFFLFETFFSVPVLYSYTFYQVYPESVRVPTGHQRQPQGTECDDGHVCQRHDDLMMIVTSLFLFTRE
jgi:hypothetical protein